MVKVIDKNTRTTPTPDQRQRRRSGAFIVFNEHISRLFPVFLLLTSNK